MIQPHRIALRRAREAYLGKHKKSIIKESVDRLNSLMALGESRREAKDELRQQDKSTWAFSTGKIHSYKTRQTYQEHALRLVRWSRETYGVKTLAALDQRADGLASEYLQMQQDQGKSAYTLLTIRSSFRMFFGNRSLCASVQMPTRSQKNITRSRGEKAHDRHFNPDNHKPLVAFLLATGLRRDEVRMLRVEDARKGSIYVRNGKGGKPRVVPVLPGHEQSILSAIADKTAGARVFDRIPRHMDVHSYRRLYAQSLYQILAPGRGLPPSEGRLKASDYDKDAVLTVSRALGHNRLDVVLRHYLR